MSLVEKILEELSRPALRYKGMPVNLLGLPSFKDYNHGSVRATLWRLSKKCLIEKDLKGWHVTKMGKSYLKRKADSLRNFDSNFRKNAPKNLIVMYDIDENKKAEREWLRWHLKKFNYEMVQRSVWVGPSPLPEEFMKYVEEIKLRSAIKTFKLAKPYELYKENS